MERNRDFIRECNRQRRLAYEAGEQLSDRLIVDRAIKAEAPAYYLEYGYARRAVGDYLRGCEGNPPATDAHSRSARMRQLHELSLKCKALMEREGLTLSTALVRVLAFEHASSYFLSQGYGLKLYYQLKKEMHRRSARLRSRRLL